MHEAPERSHESRFVGRDRELGFIREAWERAVTGQCELVTVVGDPGIGKSRLVAEALATLDVRVVRGRCLPYGEGITYWPVVEVIKQLDAAPSDPVAAGSIGSLLGETEQSTSAEEIGWAFRKLLEEQAPLVVVFDDIQWGEQTFLDLVEGIALLSSGSPILVVCMARPELLTQRGDWPVTLRLEPLPAAAVDELIAPLPSRAAGANLPCSRRESALRHRDARDGRRDTTTSTSRRLSAPSSLPASTSSTLPSAPCSSAVPSKASSSTAALFRRSRPRKPRSRPGWRY